MIKDYAIVGITAFHSRDKVKSLFYYFNILFDKPSLEKYENNGELFHPQYFNEDTFISQKDFYYLRQFISLYTSYILNLIFNNKKMLNDFYDLPKEEYPLIKDTIFKLIKIYSQDIFWHAEVNFEKYFSNEEILQELDRKYSEEGYLKNKPSFLWDGVPWGAFSGIRFVFEEEYKNLDIKVRGFGMCGHLFDT